MMFYTRLQSGSEYCILIYSKIVTSYFAGSFLSMNKIKKDMSTN